MVANRDPQDLEGVAVHIYRATRDMERRFFFDADGELLIIPQEGRLTLITELGRIDLAPGEGRGGRVSCGCLSRHGVRPRGRHRARDSGHRVTHSIVLSENF